VRNFTGNKRFETETGTIIPSPDYIKNSRSKSTALTLTLIQVRLTIMQTGNGTETDKKPLPQEILKKQTRSKRMHRAMKTSVADPDLDPSDTYVFRHSGFGSRSICQRYGSGSFYHQAKIVRKTLIPTVL
jgi:hypothetical protein